MKPIELPIGDTLDINEIKVIVIALMKASHNEPLPEMQVKMRDIAYKLARQVPPPFHLNEITPP